ncbi:MAG TPA: GAF domain-containing sensor histidine kinase [Gaiellaceae bacterium]|nr:GAF domain-containing sensor histidine kinase [Gaiellaceae bacterium]
MERSIGLAEIGELGTRALASSAEAIATVCELAHRTTGVDLTIVSEVTDDGRYVFRGFEKRGGGPGQRDAAIPYEWSLCSRIHAGESPATVPDTRDVPALWHQWLRLKEGLGVEWDILAFCTRDVRLPDGGLFGTLCVHHLEPRQFSADEQALLEVLARLLGQELWRERARVELADALAALDAAEERRVELVEELRHELRAPLQVIDGYAEAMLDQVVAADDDHLTLVRREAGRAAQLLDDLAELARLEARAASEEPTIVAADETALEMRERLAPLAEAAGIELVAEVIPAAVLLPRKRLEQYFVNLVRNALRAVEQGRGSRITIFVRREPAAVVIGVEDDGPGIAPDELPRVFERFYRGGAGRESGSGSGLGLTIARRIVEATHGEIGAEPSPGGGARIFARLPPAP